MPADKALKPIRLKKIEEYNLDMAKDPLPFSLPGVCDQEEVSSSIEVEKKTNGSNDGPSRGADPPSYDEAMNNSSFQEQVDSDLARDLHSKLNSE